jgi:diaminopropionate ammonia-lyase
MCRYSFNKHRQAKAVWAPETEAAFSSADILDLHQSLVEYRPTPLIELPALSDQLGVSRVLVKDEAQRFGLKAFKALGATYAIYRFLIRECEQKGRRLPPADSFYRAPEVLLPGRFTFCTATDGNHGRGVAWAARKLGQEAAIFMPGNTVPSRIDAIRSEGAQVTVINGSYDDAVMCARNEAERHGWQIISDTSWPGYEEIPRWIMAGYLTLFREVDSVLTGQDGPDVVFVQSGVGALAAAAAWHYERAAVHGSVRLVSVEPTDADCLLESAGSDTGEARSSYGRQMSIMAGLNCGTPSVVAWPLIRDRFDLFMTVTDDMCREAMRQYFRPLGNDPRIVSGESGAAGLAALLTLVQGRTCAELRQRLGLSGDSKVLLLNTEGDTDPLAFSRIVATS